MKAATQATLLVCIIAAAVATTQTDQVAVKCIPHKDNEWYSLTVLATDKTRDKFYEPSFDTSDFIPSSAPYGLPDPQSRWECPYNKASLIAHTSRDLFPANNDLLLRRLIDLPAGVSSLEVKITAHRAVAVYLNGSPVSGTASSAIVTPGGLCAAKDNVVLTIPDRLIRTGSNLFAVRVYGAAELNYFDVEVRAFFLRPIGDAGNVYSWGKGYYGILGNGYETDSFLPGRILDLKDLKGQALKSLALGVSHTLLLTESGKVYSWGRGLEGQLGVSEEYTEVPMAVSALSALGSSISAIAAGSLHSLVVDAKGRVYCFGDNSEGQCGQGDENTDASVTEPTLVRGLDSEVVVLIGAKDTFSVAVTDEGKVFAWGRGERDATYIDVVADVKQLSVGSLHALLLTGTGSVYVFGQGAQGQLGLGQNKTEQATPVRLEALKDITIKRVVAGSDNSFAVTDKGKVFVWGAGSFGKNGLGVWDSHFQPTEVTALSGMTVRSIGAGMTNTLFLTDKGEVYHSGSYLRDGTHTLSPTFWASASDKFFVDVYSSHIHYAALTRPSSWSWTRVGDFYEGTMKA